MKCPQCFSGSGQQTASGSSSHKKWAEIETIIPPLGKSRQEASRCDCAAAEWLKSGESSSRLLVKGLSLLFSRQRVSPTVRPVAFPGTAEQHSRIRREGKSFLPTYGGIVTRTGERLLSGSIPALIGAGTIRLAPTGGSRSERCQCRATAGPSRSCQR